jgi:(S)-ureidoglycine aminohydrolase
MQHLGFTRSAHQPDHLLSTPDTFIRAPFPGLTKATAIVHISPARGAAFTEYTVEMDATGALQAFGTQRFVYVLEGDIRIGARELTQFGYAFFPEHSSQPIEAITPARLTVIEKPYRQADGIAGPEPLFGDESALPSQFLLDDPWLEVRTLLPADPSFDFAVNTLTFQPGASLPMTEIHVMEHGLLMLEGSGIYKLNESWYPVTAGDFIWMAPYCPQWFGALGKTPAKYLLYKDFNRGPLACK